MIINIENSGQQFFLLGVLVFIIIGAQSSVVSINNVITVFRRKVTNKLIFYMLQNNSTPYPQIKATFYDS